jgi:NAD(P)-dependent dehydrogenase (short-subunit alcohol dehydrogenase family)
MGVLAGKLCLVTGATRGIGLGIARALGREGARLVVTARSAQGVAETEHALRADGIEVLGIVHDLADADGAEAFVADIGRRCGPVDVLFNNAGTSWGAPAESYPLAGWIKVVQINLTGTWALTRAVAAGGMIDRGTGSIVMIGSIAGLGGVSPDDVPTVAYNATKAAQINLVKNLAAEWGPFGLRVNAILPGWMPTRMTHSTLADRGDVLTARIPMRRLGDPDRDIAGPALFFASDASRYVTGQALCVDGGLSALVG